MKMANNLNHCDLCPKTFTNRNSLSGQKLIHSGEKKHNCPQCNKSFKSAGGVKSKKKTHTQKHKKKETMGGKKKDKS